MFCRNPHERFILSETSIFTISDGDANGIDGKSIVNFGLQIENGKGYLSNFERVFANRYLL